MSNDNGGPLGYLIGIALVVALAKTGVPLPVPSLSGLSVPVPPALSAPALAPVSAPAGTREWWAQELLARLSLPATPSDQQAIVRWEQTEGGNWANTARYNPLNTTQREPGSYSMNSVGVQAFPSWEVGLTATVATLHNGRYGAILAALAVGNCAQCVANAVGASSWGTPRFTA